MLNKSRFVSAYQHVRSTCRSQNATDELVYTVRTYSTDDVGLSYVSMVVNSLQRMALFSFFRGLPVAINRGSSWRSVARSASVCMWLNWSNVAHPNLRRRGNWLFRVCSPVFAGCSCQLSSADTRCNSSFIRQEGRTVKTYKKRQTGKNTDGEMWVM